MYVAEQLARSLPEVEADGRCCPQSGDRAERGEAAAQCIRVLKQQPDGRGRLRGGVTGQGMLQYALNGGTGREWGQREDGEVGGVIIQEASGLRWRGTIH